MQEAFGHGGEEVDRGVEAVHQAWRLADCIVPATQPVELRNVADAVAASGRNTVDDSAERSGVVGSRWHEHVSSSSAGSDRRPLQHHVEEYRNRYPRLRSYLELHWNRSFRIR